MARRLARLIMSLLYKDIKDVITSVDIKEKDGKQRYAI